jgi:HSP20 family molecular chaperone IbpA
MKKIALVSLPLLAISLSATSLNNDPFFNDPFGDDIFKEMMVMQKQMDKMFAQMHQRIQQRSSGMLTPVGTFKINQKSLLEDKGNLYELITSIPQSDKNSIDITTHNGMLSITAKIVKEHKESKNGVTSVSSNVQVYQEAISLPKDANTKAISTEYRDGRLVVVIQKKRVAKLSKPNTVHINGVEQPIKIIKKDDNKS